ncbi:CARDB domain-containing protein [Methanobacterium aggregans]|uniref:CARDB domain-containing protein n=1 Tax=Methanobacterium aggregans TaxID=1615586 RepID=UPI001AEA3714|nr:CARDB domain-containing protein [Methanobacterium aggregans]MBP2045301.1 hypothetical protein [Methanobacterium aggregans]
MVRSEIITCAFFGLLIISLFISSSVEAAGYPDLSVIGVSPWDANMPNKLVSGYRVAVANYGSAPSPNSTMEFYVRTYDGKTLNKNFTVPSIPAGSARSLKFSMCNGTDGSFKNGYVVVNKKKSFREITYKNNARNFGLKETIPLSSNLTVEEFRKDNTPVSSTLGFSDLVAYNSPLSSQINVTKIEVSVYNPPSYWYNMAYARFHIPGYLHENTTLLISGNYYSPSSWDADTITFDFPDIYRTDNARVIISGNSLETKSAFREPFEFVNTGGVNVVADGNQWHRTAYESYTSPYTWVKISTKTAPLGSSYTASPSANKITVRANNGGRYVAGWFLIPRGNFTNITALYGSNSLQAVNATGGYYGVFHPCSRQDSIGFQMEGSNLGFSNFRSFGFSPWTWREQY